MKFYLKLALGNIKKNKKLYTSYFVSTIFSIALYFIVRNIGQSPTLKDQQAMTMFLGLGSGVISIFSFIFLLYTNSFVIKNRKKEISLYHILGMEKRNIRSMMFLENTHYCPYFSFIRYFNRCSSFANNIGYYLKIDS